MNKKKNKEMTPRTQNLTPGTQNILNIISPASIDVGKNSIDVGENFGKIFTIFRLPPGVDYGWLSDLCNMEATVTQVEFVTGDAENLIATYDSMVKVYAGELADAKTESEKQNIEKAVKDVKKMIKCMSDEPVGYLNILIYVQAPTAIILESRIKKVKTKVASIGSSLKLLAFKQEQAYKCITPYGLPDTVVSNIGNRNVPLSTYIGGFPMGATGLNDPHGIYLGKTKQGRLVFVDPGIRDNDRTNSNWFISGIPGVGKSTLIKLILLMLWALGTKVIIMDPEREYVSMAKRLGGVVIDCMGGKNGRINPLQIRKSPALDNEKEEEKEEEDLYVYDPENPDSFSDMALHIQTLRMQFKLYKPDMTDTNLKYLEESLIEVYNKHGITWNTDIDTLKNEDYPLISELYQHVEDKAQDKKNLQDYERIEYRKLSDMLYSAGKGADRFVWNGYSTINQNENANFIVLDTSKLVSTDDTIKNAQYFNICSWMWDQAAKDRNEKVAIGFDEGYTVVDDDMPYTIKSIRNMSKRARKYGAGTMFITHSPTDVLDPKVQRYGETIINDATYKFLLGCEGNALAKTKEIFNLTEQEEAILAAKQRGKGILFAGTTRFSMSIDVKQEYLDIFGKEGGK